MKDIIWSYWETKPGSFRPPYLDLCEETWRRHCGDDFEIRRVTPETVESYAPGLIDDWHRIPVLAHKADYLRAVLLFLHGGIWLDADIIVLRNLRVMMTQLANSGSDFLGVGRAGNRPSNGVLCAKPGCALLGTYIEKMNEYIAGRQGNLKMAWTAIGYQILWPLAKTYRYFQYPFRVGHPIPPARFPVFFQESALGDLKPPDCDLQADTLTVYLYNAMFPMWFKKMSREEILRSPMVIGQLFRKALSAPSEELFGEMIRIANRGQLPALLKRSGLNGRICELGVLQGEYLSAIVRGAEPELAIGIDPWTDDGMTSRNAIGFSAIDFQTIERSVHARFESFGERVRLVKGYSFEEVRTFPDGYFDFVYIDADHSYTAVQRDIEDWYAKVRPGGVLAGHDYLARQTERVTYGVIEAVDEFVRKNDIRQFVTTPEHFSTWMILKEEAPQRPTYCYWTIAFGHPTFQSQTRSLIKSARAAGVTADFHVWAEAGAELEDCQLHVFDRRIHSARNYMFKLEVLKAMQEYKYDYYVYLDADNFFVRAPNVGVMLYLANPLHLSQCSPINSSSYTQEYRIQQHWRNITLQQMIDAFHAKGITVKALYAQNGGFFVVKREAIPTVYDLCWEGFRYLYDECGYPGTIDEHAFTYAMAKLAQPDEHLMANRFVSDIWCTDRGQYKGVLPDGKPFKYNSNWDGRTLEVNPAIIHARKSKPQLLDYSVLRVTS